MGSVWLAEDTKLDGREVAIKMLPTVLVGKKGAFKQVKESALMAMELSHPNIVTVRAFEEDEGGTPFLVMDYIEGEGLDDILAERGALSEEETVRLLGPVAAALDYAHSQGVVHRDVKPGNVMVRKDGTPFVLDFGIAREIQETMTRVTGKLPSGTLLYMSPEQLNGRSPNSAQDVYSFAAMAYECLSGRPPFSRGQIEWQIVNNPPGPLPEHVGKALWKGVMAGLAKEAELRPGSCAEVLGKGGVVEGQRSKIGKDGGEGNSENRWADRERRGRGEGKNEGSGGGVFLTKVKLENGLKEAEWEPLTEGEKAELGRVRELWAAGAEALKYGSREDAGGLFAKAEASLGTWKAGVAARKERERAEAEARERAEEERRLAEEERRRAEEREAREKRAAEEREASARRAVERARMAARARKVLRWLVAGVLVAWALVWGPGAVLRGLRNRSLRNSLAEMGAGSHAGEETTITFPRGPSMTFVWCPAGKFTMGSPMDEEGRADDEARHRGTLTKGFWMAKTEVTQAQWEYVMGNNPSDHEGGNLPVECVSWKDCQKFCQKLGLALPTEAEWEYACRAGSTGPYAGNGWLYDMGWYNGNSGNETHPVGQKMANAWGLHDMHGNVWEWCADWYESGYYAKSAAMDPKGSASGGSRVLRGGCFWTIPQRCRSAFRNWHDPGDRDRYYGFRPVLREDK